MRGVCEVRADSKTTTDVAPRSAQATEERAVCCTCAILFISPFWSSEATKTKPKHFLSIFCGSPLHPRRFKRKGKEIFGFGSRLEGARGAGCQHYHEIRAYDLVQSYHSLRACIILQNPADSARTMFELRPENTAKSS